MNLTRCAKGHYYDMDKFSMCPHCASANEGMGQTMRYTCLLYTSPSPRDISGSRMPSSA